MRCLFLRRIKFNDSIESIFFLNYTKIYREGRRCNKGLGGPAIVDVIGNMDMARPLGDIWLAVIMAEDHLGAASDNNWIFSLGRSRARGRQPAGR